MVQADRGGAAAARTLTPWRSYLPDFVLHAMRDQQVATPVATTDLVDAVVLFADIVGFTPMSEALGRAGIAGGEQLTSILNDWLGVMAARISSYGGTIAEFAGDALIAVFDSGQSRHRRQQGAVRRTIQCALDMQSAMVDFPVLESASGKLSLAMKVGIADGPLLLTIMGDPAFGLRSVLAGDALNQAAAAERQALRGEVVVNAGLMPRASGIDATVRGGDWRVIRHLRRPPRPAAVRARTTRRSVDEPTVDQVAPFLDPGIVERLRSGRRELVNEHRIVTVAFVGLPDLIADIPQSVLELQHWLSAATRVIAAHDGYLHQLATGDKGTLLIAYFGAPRSHEDDQERAVRCCLDLVRLPGGPLRAGVTTGLLYAGEVGSDTRRTYAVIGDSVNLAARLLQAAGPGEVLVDDQTHRAIDRVARQDRLAPIAVKGKADPVAVWSVRAVQEPTGRHLASGIPTAPLVGRQDEVAQISELIGHANAGHGRVISLTGEAGIGKSRFAIEAARIARDNGFAVYSGACSAHGVKTSYLVWRSIWRGLLGIDIEQPLWEQPAELVGRIAKSTGATAAHVPLLSPLVNVPMPDSELTAALEPRAKDELLRGLLLDYLRQRVADRPLLLTLDDCHWIDPASQALLNFLARNIADLPVVVLMIAREEGATSLLRSLSPVAWFAELRLSDLPAADAEMLVRDRIRRRYGSSTAISANLITQIASRGEGNPFYLEELVSFLHSRGIDPRDALALSTLDLPPNLQQLMMARLDQLTEGEKATIKVASIIGRRFRASWIARTYPPAGTVDQVRTHLEHLAELELTPVHTVAEEVEYTFKHAITQDTAYGSLTFGLRERLHERVGELIETTYPDRVAEFVDLIAHHYGQTRRVDKQRVWYRAAGDTAKATFANETAVDYYEKLLPLLPAQQTGAVLAELGDVFHLTGRWDRADDAYRRAMHVAARFDDRALLAATRRGLGNTLMYQRSNAEAIAWLTRAADDFEQLGDRRGLSSVLDRLTYTLIRQSSYGAARATAERHLAVATEAGDLAGSSMAANHLGLISSSTGEPARAVELLEQALEMATKADDEPCLIHAAHNLACVQYWRGDQQQAAHYWLDSLAAARRIGYRQDVAIAIGNLGEVYREQGNYADALKCFGHAFRIAVELGDWTEVAGRAEGLATTAAAQGRHDEAEWLFISAVALARRLDAPYLAATALHHQAQLYLARARFTEAATLNSQALDLARKHNEHDVRARAELLSLRLDHTLGKISTSDAVGHLQGLKKSWSEPQDRAPLLDFLAELDGTPDAKTEAAALYRSLYEHSASIEYRERYTRLTGETLPGGAALPPPPDIVEADVVDLRAVSREVERAAELLTVM